MMYLTEGLVAAAKRSEFFPTGQTTLTDPDDLIAFANEEMQTKLIPALMSVRQDMFRAREIVPLQGGLNHYPIPERAVGSAFKDLWYLPDPATPWVKRPLRKVDAHNEDRFDMSQGIPSVFNLEGDEVILIPTPAPNSGAIMFTFYERPNQLIPTASCARITGISSAGGLTTLTVNTDLTAQVVDTPLVNGAKVDVLASTSPFRLWAKAAVIQSITATTIVLNTVDVSNEIGTVEPQIGDYVCPAQRTCIPMIPQEFHPILAEMICFRALKSLGAAQKLQICSENIRDMVKNLVGLVANRVEAEVDVVYDRDSLFNGMPIATSQIALK